MNHVDSATLRYATTHDAIRRYDKNHLILGDRYELRAPVAEEVLKAARPWVDAMSFQYFAAPSEARRELQRMHHLTGKPVLLADAAIPGRRTAKGAQLGARHAEMLTALAETPGCVGWHVCGAYLANRARGYGFLDETGQADPAFLTAVARANRETQDRVRRE